MIHKPLEAITSADLDALVADGVREGRAIDFKDALPGGTDADKKEFLADVSSFANTSGGDLIFGVKEDAGLAVDVLGIAAADLDAEIRRLDSLTADGLEPRIRHRAQVVAHARGPVVVLRVERSWIGPHRVVLKGHDKFYARNSAGKYPLDVTELRQAFLASATTADRLRAFRSQRLQLIQSQAGPAIALTGAGRLVVHLLPAEAFSGEPSNRVSSGLSQDPALEPMTGPGISRINFDGVLSWTPNPKGRLGYTQVFRSGVLEAVDARLPGLDHGTGPVVPATALEMRLMKFVPAYLSLLRRLGVAGPVFLCLSLLGVKGCRLEVSQQQSLYDGGERYPFDGDLILPEVELTEDTSDIPAALRPPLDLIWNACGYEGSLNYRPDGSWRAQQA